MGIDPPCHEAVLYVSVGTFPVCYVLHPTVPCWDGDVQLEKKISRMKVSQNPNRRVMETVLAGTVQLVEN